MKKHTMLSVVVLMAVLTALSGCAGGPADTDGEQVRPAPGAEQPVEVTVPEPVTPVPEEAPFTDTYMAGSMSELVTALQNILADHSFNTEFTIEVTRNISVTAPITLSQIIGYYNKIITIRGNGGEKTIVFNTNGSLFTIADGLTLILDRDITLKGYKNNNTALVSVARGGELVLREGSKLTGNTNTTESEGGGVTVQNGGRLVMLGGDISGNESPFGGGVYVDNMGSLDMSAGSISGNSATSRGGGVYVTSGTVKLSGGAVSDNALSSESSTSGGAGLYVTGGNFTITGGKIDGNVSTSTRAGGVYLTGDVVCTMSGGSISNNIASTNGGGIYIFKAKLNISGGAISGNRTTATDGNGGGIYITHGSSSNDTTTLTMTGGLISDNSASSGGGIHAYTSWYYSGSTEYSYGTMITMKGGAISGNSATKGGGVYLYHNNFVMSGTSLINGNSAEEGSGVYVAEAIITLSEEAGIDRDNAVCLNYIAGTSQGRHQSAIYMAGEISGDDEVATVELRGSSNVTDAAQWNQKILKRTSAYKGEFPTARFTLDRFIPEPVTNENPIVSLTGYQIDSEGDLVQE
jgi:hypothetical protein